MKKNEDIKSELKKSFSYRDMFFIFLIITLAIIISIFISVNLPYSFNSGEKIIYINYGSGLKNISDKLEENKIIKNKFLFQFYAIITSANKKIKAGEYKFYDYESMKKVISKLIKGDVLKHKIVIPEGSDINDIANILSMEKLINKERFLNIVQDKDFIAQLGLNYKNLEGLLFPDTYYFVLGESEEKIIKTMYERFKTIVNIDLNKYYNIYGYNIKGYNLLKLASIIEKEAKFDGERPIIASVFYNRLKSSEPYQRRLESCATVRYALMKKYGQLTIKDLKVNSPYNTYQIIGFPPTPICSPGFKSIQAALTPAKTNYFYFVVKENGEHNFSSDIKSHIKYKNLNKRKK